MSFLVNSPVDWFFVAYPWGSRQRGRGVGFFDPARGFNPIEPPKPVSVSMQPDWNSLESGWN
ncbi:hypothetical protein CWM47_32230 [Spirosoma pollinicola]|uniref:Uncharacterized protein n=1 Tax=Spirosoma pollinicola TaxID=2057025 RepID=A0A2K8Z8A3_9BACT|nr:hypothetical protein CWM47_32230 [Spirosoma pollinicola]